jgi:hypothetical protein
MDGVWIAVYIAKTNPKVDGGKGISNLEERTGTKLLEGNGI